MTALVATVAIGLMCVIAAGGMDFSVGPMAALAASIAQSGDLPYAMTILVALAAGILCGLVNGILVTRSPVPHYVVTLAMCAVLIGVAPGLPDGGTPAGTGIPVGVWVAAAIAVIAHVVLTQTRWGLRVFFVGSSETTARLSGIRSQRVKLVVYLVSGVLAALAGVLAPTVGLGSGLRLDLTVFTAVAIGGVSLSGGRGSVIGVVLGSVVCVQVLDLMDAWGIGDHGQRCAQIVVLLLVITYNEWRIKVPAAR